MRWHGLLGMDCSSFLSFLQFLTLSHFPSLLYPPTLLVYFPPLRSLVDFPPLASPSFLYPEMWAVLIHVTIVLLLSPQLSHGSSPISRKQSPNNCLAFFKRKSLYLITSMILALQNLLWVFFLVLSVLDALM